MPKDFSIDYSQLSDTISKRRFKLSDVKDKIEKVAFDVVRFKDSSAEELWQIQNADDGDYIVALYDEDKMEKEANHWSVAMSKFANDLNVFYKKDPIVKLAASKLGIQAADFKTLEKSLPKKLAESKKLVIAMLQELAESERQEVLNKYPELA